MIYLSGGKRECSGSIRTNEYPIRALLTVRRQYWPVIRSNIILCSSLYKQPRLRHQDIPRAKSPLDTDSQTLSAVLIDDRQHPQRPAVMDAIVKEVV